MQISVVTGTQNETWDRDTARLRHGYIIKYEGCAIMWKSQVQTKIALSSTESEYTGLSFGLRSMIPIMRLLKEMKALKYTLHTVKAKVHFRVFEDKKTEHWRLLRCTSSIREQIISTSNFTTFEIVSPEVRYQYIQSIQQCNKRITSQNRSILISPTTYGYGMVKLQDESQNEIHNKQNP
jgi:hypothetical protein